MEFFSTTAKLINNTTGKALAWDVTVMSTMADSYLHAASTGSGEVAKLASRIVNLDRLSSHTT